MKYLLIFLLFQIASQGQNATLELQSLYSNAGIYQLEKVDDRIGISGSVEATFSLDENLFSTVWSIGYGVFNRDDILKNAIHLFTELDVLYGRRFELLPYVNLAIFSGIGFTEQSKLKNKNSGSSFTIPLRGKLYYEASRFQIGVVSHLNFNSQNDIYMYQILIGYNF